MPAGKGKPALGYHAGKKGSHGCKGYPTVSADGTVHGCHPTKTAAADQARAIWASVNTKKFNEILQKSMVAEGDFVIASFEDDVYVGIVEYVMTNGTFGRPASEYAIEATPEDPAVLVRILEFEEDEGIWQEEETLVGVASSMLTRISPLPLEVEVTMTMDQEVAMYDAQLGKRDPSTATRERMAAEGTAMPDGSFPIANASDLRNAIQSVGRAKDYSAAKQHIIRRARALGMTSTLPEDWKNSAQKGMTGWGGTVFDLNPFVK